MSETASDDTDMADPPEETTSKIKAILDDYEENCYEELHALVADHGVVARPEDVHEWRSELRYYVVGN
jgi:hypothetical protein